jgi:hypothetical protein
MVLDPNVGRSARPQLMVVLTGSRAVEPDVHGVGESADLIFARLIPFCRSPSVGASKKKKAMNLKERQWIIGGVFLLIAIIFIGRLAQLQLLSSNLQDYAARLTQEREILAPARGLIFDRTGELFLDNKAGYDILFTPRQCRIAGGMDTLALAQLIGLTPNEIQKAIRKAEAYATDARF